MNVETATTPESDAYTGLRGVRNACCSGGRKKSIIIRVEVTVLEKVAADAGDQSTAV